MKLKNVNVSFIRGEFCLIFECFILLFFFFKLFICVFVMCFYIIFFVVCVKVSIENNELMVLVMF